MSSPLVLLNSKFQVLTTFFSTHTVSPQSRHFLGKIIEKAYNSAMNEARRPGRTNLASCVATIFLFLGVEVIVIVYLCVFNPKDPKIAVDAVRFPTFSISNGTVDFAFSQYVAVKNPNRDTFTHYDSSVQLVYSGSEVGFMFIRARKIDPGRTQ